MKLRFWLSHVRCPITTCCFCLATSPSPRSWRHGSRKSSAARSRPCSRYATQRWSAHVGEIRVVVAADMRGEGIGRLLIQETFRIAVRLRLEKLTAQMTVDQRGAIAVFESMGFRGEALLRDHVKDRAGIKHDLVILSHDVARFQSQMEAYGAGEAP